MAGLEATVEPFTEQSRIRFHYYEGTHGVQLKGCCSSIENCPFSSDKFVTVADRSWKTASFKCPKGTDKVNYQTSKLQSKFCSRSFSSVKTQELIKVLVQSMESASLKIMDH